jgi:hypothetical protein
LAPRPQDRYPFGAIDAKVSSVNLASGRSGGKRGMDKNGQMWTASELQGSGKAEVGPPVVLVKMGPTTANHLPPFCWSQVRHPYPYPYPGCSEPFIGYGVV